MDLKTAYGRTLANRRKKLGLSCADVALRIGRSEKFVASLESGARAATLNQYEQLGIALNMEPRRLLVLAQALKSRHDKANRTKKL